MAKDFRTNVEVNGNLNLKKTSGDVSFTLDAPVATYKLITLSTSGSNRWALFSTTDAESGANNGSNLTISRYSDGGSYIDDPLRIARATGTITLSTPLSVTSTTTFSGSISGTNALFSSSHVALNSVVTGQTPANLTSRGATDFSGGAMRFLSWGAVGTGGTFSWWTGTGALGATQRMSLDNTGALTVTGDITASAGTTTLGNVATGSSVKINGATLSDPLAVKVDTNRSFRVTNDPFTGRASLDATNLAGTGYANLQISGLEIMIRNSSSAALYIDSTGNVTIYDNLTASAGNTYLGAASMVGVTNPGSIATQSWVQSQGYSTSAASIQYSTASLRNTSTTVYSQPTGMTGITLRAGVLYKYEISILYRVITTNQVFKNRLNHPAFTVGTAHVVIGTNTTQVSYLGLEKTLTGTQTTLDSTTTTNAGAGLLHQRVDGFILPSASGVLSYDFAPTSAATGADVFENSYMLVTPVTAV